MNNRPAPAYLSIAEFLRQEILRHAWDMCYHEIKMAQNRAWLSTVTASREYADLLARLGVKA